MKLDNRAIGQRILLERKKLSLSREELAEIVDLSNYYVGQLERGERQMSLPVLIKIAGSLHLTLDYLVLGRKPQHAGYVHEPGAAYRSPDQEINSLIAKCSPRELNLLKKLIRTVLPYISGD